MIEEINNSQISPNIPFRSIVYSSNCHDPVVKSVSYLIKYNLELRDKIEILNNKFDQYVNKKQRKSNIEINIFSWNCGIRYFIRKRP